MDGHVWWADGHVAIGEKDALLAQVLKGNGSAHAVSIVMAIRWMFFAGAVVAFQ